MNICGTLVFSSSLPPSLSFHPLSLLSPPPCLFASSSRHRSSSEYMSGMFKTKTTHTDCTQWDKDRRRVWETKRCGEVELMWLMTGWAHTVTEVRCTQSHQKHRLILCNTLQVWATEKVQLHCEEVWISPHFCRSLKCSLLFISAFADCFTQSIDWVFSSSFFLFQPWQWWHLCMKE